MICQGCGGPGEIRYSDIENGLVFRHLCPSCHALVVIHMAAVLKIVRTPYAHFRAFMPSDAKSNPRPETS